MKSFNLPTEPIKILITGKTFYKNTEIYLIQSNENGFDKIDEDSTLEVNYEGKNSCADIHLSKDENYLYLYS